MRVGGGSDKNKLIIGGQLPNNVWQRKSMNKTGTSICAIGLCLFSNVVFEVAKGGGNRYSTEVGATLVQQEYNDNDDES